MATNQFNRPSTGLPASRWVMTRCVVLGTIAALSLSLVVTGPAAADPGSHATQAPPAQTGGQLSGTGVAANRSFSASTKRSAAAVAVAAARSKSGAPYVYGAAGPNVFDCSGLTYWAWAKAGVRIPRTSRGQAGLPSVPLSQLRPGDLVTYYSPVHHVAMYIGNGQVIHASTKSRPVYITTVNRAGRNPTGHRVTG